MTVRVELPAWYIDEVALDDLELLPGDPYFTVLNRDAEPDATDVRVDADVGFTLATDFADSPDEAQIDVWVTVGSGAEVLVFSGGAFQIAVGSGSGTTDLDDYTLRFNWNPATDFPPLTQIQIRIAAESDGGQFLDESWSFVTEDLIAPRLVSAQARSETRVRLTFDEPVSAVTALDPENYALERLTFPSVTIQAVSVEQVTDLVFDLVLNTEATFGARYRVTVSDVEDFFGNVIVPPDDTAEFVAYTCQAPEGRDFDLYRMLPRRSRDNDETGELRDFVACLQEVANLILCKIDHWTDILDPDLASEPFLDAMLADLGNPFSFDLDVIGKRKLIRILVAIYRQKGTAVGIINAVRFFLGIEVTITTFLGDEGWDLGIDELGETTILGPSSSFARFSFEIVSPVVLTEEQREQIAEIANYMKPAHTHLIRIVEPEVPDVIDHIELGLSELGPEWILH